MKPIAAAAACDGDKLMVESSCMSALLAEHDALRSKLVTKTATADEKREFVEVLERLEEARAEDKAVRIKMAEIEAVMKLVEAAERVDLCFVVDATGSMRNYIVGVKRQILTIVKHITTINSGASLRLGLVAYRDFGPPKLHMETFDFVLADRSGLKDFENFISKVRATSTGLHCSDTCEDVAGGLRQAVNLSWAHPTRVIFHIADAPPHGSRYWSQKHPVNVDFDKMKGLDHSGPEGIPSTIRQMQALGITYQFARIKESTAMQPHLDQMIRAMNADAKAANFVKVADMTTPHALTSSVIGAVTAATSHTVDVLRGAKAADLADVKRDLKSIPEERKRPERDSGILADVYMNAPFTDITSLCEKTKLAWIKMKASDMYNFLGIGSAVDMIGAATSAISRLFTGPVATLPVEGSSGSSASSPDRAMIRIAKEPFASGSCRYAFRGEMDEARGSKRYIFKSFITKPRNNQLYLEQMEVSAAASFLAKRFEEVLAKKTKTVIITVMDAFVVQTVESERRYFFVEDELPLKPGGDFTKWCNNAGHWDLSEKSFEPALAEFALWTHEVTKGHMMVVDLQGVKRKVRDAKGNLVTEFLLTDPAINCKDVCRFSETNMGPKGLERCVRGARAALDIGCGRI